MPKINYFRGETRASVFRKDGGSRQRKSNARRRRGRGGLIADYRYLFNGVGVRAWCPCCIGWEWAADHRRPADRQRARRYVHRAMRTHGKRLCRQTDEE